jgi:hypothetical protein
MWDPAWVGVASSLLIQIGLGLFVIGKYSERFQRIARWIDEDAEPTLDDHESRIVTLEAQQE